MYFLVEVLHGKRIDIVYPVLILFIDLWLKSNGQDHFRFPGITDKGQSL